MFATEKLRIHIETSDRYRSIGMLGKEMEYEISARHICDLFLGSNREICNFW